MRHHGAGWLGGLLLALGAPTGALAQDLHGQDHAQHPAAPAAEAQDQQHRHDDAMVPRTATLLPGYGNGGFAVSTGNAEAQKFFANGLELHAAFAHRAAVAAMTEAVRLDPACAMCKWGLALTDGPTINYGKDAKERGPLLVLAREAQAGVRRSGTARERALTDALVLRYAPGKDTARADDRYAAAMQAAVVLLEKVLKRAPDHTPAIHFYIHATEVIGKPELAEAYADRLAGLAPRASHLVHMPSHTWYWVGRYQDAARTNRAAVELGKANARALGLPDPKGVWDLPYHAHNVIYGLGGALMAGDSRIALDLARPLVERSATDDKARPWSQLLAASGYFALARFDPASVGALPEPKLGYLKAAWHYARGESLVWAGDLTGARAEAAAIPPTLIQGKPERDAMAAEQMLGITRAVLEGRIAMAEARWKDAADLFRKAAEIEETEEFSDFSDPPAFWYPVRRDLAAALLAAGDAASAQREAEASLRLRQLDPVAMQVLAAARTALDRDSPLVR